MSAVALAFDTTEIIEPPSTLGPYRLLDLVADGGMASIFRAQDLQSNEIVAVKTVRTAAAHEIAGLEREIEVLRELRHPGVVRFVAEGTWWGMPWMAVDLLRGRTLFDEILWTWMGVEDQGPSVRPLLPFSGRRIADSGWAQRLDADPGLDPPGRISAGGRLRETLSHVAQLATALDYVHRRGFVHLDVKPPNVFLGDDGRITLLDFGLARRPREMDATIGVNPACLATPEYAAPEQLCGDLVDARTDIYSLGCILYELVTGCPLFDGPSPDEIAQKHVDQDPVTPSTLVSGLSWKLEDLMLDLIAKDPARRPGSAGDVASQLACLLRHCA